MGILRADGYYLIFLRLTFLTYMGPWTETEGLGEISPEGSEEKTRNDVIISGVDESLPSPIIIKYHYLKDAEYITRNTGLEEIQAGIKIAKIGRASC